MAKPAQRGRRMVVVRGTIIAWSRTGACKSLVPITSGYGFALIDGYLGTSENRVLPFQAG